MHNARDSISAEEICRMSFEILRAALLYHSNDGRAHGDWLQHVETPKHQILFLGREILVDVRDLAYSFTYDEIRGLYVRTTVAALVSVSDVSENWNFGVKFATLPFLDAEFCEDDNGAVTVEIEHINSGTLQCISGDIYSLSALVAFFNKTE